MLLDKQFVLSNSSWNCYGFRLLTSGYMLNEFAKNPIGYYMHKREDGVLVTWKNIKIAGDDIIATPDVNLSNTRGQQTIDEINNGFLNAASVGAIVIVESDIDPSFINDGKTQVTVTKWYNRECSLCDIPGNPEALVLYDKDDNVINLKHSGKNRLFLNHNQPATNDALIDVDELLKNAIKNKDINQDTADELKKQYQHNPKKLKELIDELAKQRVSYLMSLEWNELDKEGLLEELKEKNFHGFKQKFFNAFHKEYAGKKPGKAQFEDDDIDVDALLSYHIKNNGLQPEVAAGLKQNFKDNPKKLKEILESRAKNRVEDLMAMEWDELDKKGLLNELKEKHLHGFQKKFKDKFGVDHKTVNQ